MMQSCLLLALVSGATAACVPSATNFCMGIDVFASETGYYTIGGHTGSMPDLTVEIGKTYTFDQSHVTNWYHPVGFAYEPDGAHGDQWGGAERPEVEGKGELLYKINGQPTTCADAGDTGLDCYEPEFFHPKEPWSKKTYTAELTITQAMADASHAGILYYFCHIHSKMSGRIIIHKAGGGRYMPTKNTAELPLYKPVMREALDILCGTTGIAPYAAGSHACPEKFLPGTHDTVFEMCLQAVDCQMNREMRVAGHDHHSDNVITFMQQMIPHHNNAVNMAKVLLKHYHTEVAKVEDLEDTLWEIVNVQNFQVHQFRGYLGTKTPASKGSCVAAATNKVDCNVDKATCDGRTGTNTWYAPGAVGANGCCHCSASCATYKATCNYADAHAPHSVHLPPTHHCDETMDAVSKQNIPTTQLPTATATPAIAGCTSTATNLCLKMNPFIGETGYYEIAGKTGPSPDIHLKIGTTYTFDQSDGSNWYHPIGFAYYADGAHGSTWGGAERAEVEGKGELLYKIDGKVTTCADAGDTGLDCYEPEFFYPKGEWSKKKYTAELTITKAVADASIGGHLYYFCHIHSKMSGRIIIQNADGTLYQNAKTPATLYSPFLPGPVDNTCGTYAVESYANGGAKVCGERFVCGSLNTIFEKCFQAIDCKMKRDMFAHTTADHTNPIAVFMQQMVAHHENAVNMAKILLKHNSADVKKIEDFEDHLWGIINVQNFQVHNFRNYLGSNPAPTNMATCQYLKDYYKGKQCCGNPSKLVQKPM